jgi:hypothetical protein
MVRANPAYLPNLATSLNTLALRLSDVGRQDEALATVTEATTTYRQLASANPASYLPTLIAATATRAAILDQLGRGTAASEAYVAAGIGLPPSAQSHLLAARATARGGEQDLTAAARLADRDTDQGAATAARRAVRDTFEALSASTKRGGAAQRSLAGMPDWLTRPYPQALVTLANTWFTTSSLADQTNALNALLRRTADPDGRADLDTLVALHADTPGVDELPSVLIAARRDGAAAVATARHRGERRRVELTDWLGTSTWAASRAFLDDHPDFLGDPLVHSLLDQARADPLVAIHLGIARLATRLPLAEIYDLVTDPADATDAALEAVEQGDADVLRNLVLAAPAVLQTPIHGPFIAGAVALLDDDPGTAAEMISYAAGQAAERTGGDESAAVAASRLLRLRRHRPDLAARIDELIAALRSTTDGTERPTSDLQEQPGPPTPGAG